MSKFCSNCGTKCEDNFKNCPNCGMSLDNNQNSNQGYNQMNNNQQMNYQDPTLKSKLAAGLLGVFLGGWGIHNFYLGNTGRGIAQIIVTLVTCGIGAIWGFIEGILILTGSINTDAQGRPLRD